MLMFRRIGLCLVILIAALWIGGCEKQVIVKEVVVKEVAAPAAPASAMKTIFSDDFATNQDINRNLWKSNGKAHWVWQKKTSPDAGCDDGCLKQNSEDERALNAVMYVSTPQMSNGTIETKARINYDLSVYNTPERLKQLKEMIGVGIVFRMVDENNFYMFRLAGEEGCVLGKMVDNNWTDLANPRRLDFLEGGRIKPSVWYKLKVEVIGGTIQCFINDSPVINLYDAQFSVGRFGLASFKCFGDFEYINVYQ